MVSFLWRFGVIILNLKFDIMKMENKTRVTRSRREPRINQHVMPSENAGDPVNPESMRMNELIEEDFERLMHENDLPENELTQESEDSQPDKPNVVSDQEDDEENYYSSLGGHPSKKPK